MAVESFEELCVNGVIAVVDGGGSSGAAEMSFRLAVCVGGGAG